MKRSLIFFLITLPVAIAAQNIGIGIATPVYKLQLHNTAAANNFMNITHTGSGISVSDGLVLGINGSDAVIVNMENGDLVLGTNNLTRMTIDNTGNVGIGITNPGAKLDINGGVKLEGLNLFEFGAGVAGKEINAGKIGYNAFGTNALAFVGAGTNATNRAVYFFAEGGTTFSGPINVTGNIQVNANPGQAGQVLTSSGVADPVWSDAALSNNTRFGVRLTENAAKSGSATIIGTYYNLDPANIVIGASSITINKSGLYHFDIGANASLNFTSATTSTPPMGVWLFFGLANSVQLIDDKFMTSASSANTYYRLNEKVSVEVYITAPASISVYHTFSTLGVGGGTSTHDFTGFLTGHLIAE